MKLIHASIRAVALTAGMVLMRWQMIGADSAHVSRRARTAAILFLLSAVLVLLNAVVWQLGGAGSRPIEFFRLAVRVVGLMLIAVGLLRGARWAWMLGVVFGGFWVLTGMLSTVATFSRSGAEVPLSSALFLASAVAVMAAAWVLLLTREVREVYRRQ